MKKLILFLFLAVFIYPAISQVNAPESKSKSVEFSARSGSLIKKDFYKLNCNLKGVLFEVLTMKDINKNEKMACLRITTSSYSSGGGTESFVGTLDTDELDACIKSINYIKDSLMNTLPAVYTECEFKTNDNVRFSAFYSEKSAFNSDKVWNITIKTTYRSASSVFFSIEKIDDLLAVLIDAKSTIVTGLNN